MRVTNRLRRPPAGFETAYPFPAPPRRLSLRRQWGRSPSRFMWRRRSSERRLAQFLGAASCLSLLDSSPSGSSKCLDVQPPRREPHDSPCREQSGQRRNVDRADSQRSGDAAGMLGPRPAEDDQGVIANVVTAFDRELLDRPGHRLIGNTNVSQGQFLHGAGPTRTVRAKRLRQILQATIGLRPAKGIRPDSVRRYSERTGGRGAPVPGWRP